MKDEKKNKKIDVNNNGLFKSSTRWLKNIGILIAYWILFGLVFIFVSKLFNTDASPEGRSVELLIGTMIIIPFLTLIPSKFAALNSRFERYLFICIGAIVPLAVLGFILYILLSISSGGMVIL